VSNKCGATTRSGSPCARGVGWGVPGKSEGRCRAHGGLTREQAIVKVYEMRPDLANQYRDEVKSYG